MLLILVRTHDERIADADRRPFFAFKLRPPGPPSRDFGERWDLLLHSDSDAHGQWSDILHTGCPFRVVTSASHPSYHSSITYWILKTAFPSPLQVLVQIQQ
jgi:hypothetical protein